MKPANGKRASSGRRFFAFSSHQKEKMLSRRFMPTFGLLFIFEAKFVSFWFLTRHRHILQ
jgi:hypothetical protein